MTTEYRPLLTAAEVVAALRAGERVEFLSTIDDARWARTSYAADTPTHDDSCLSRDIARGIRYRARPAGEESPDTQAEIAAREQIATQAAEIERVTKEWHASIGRSNALVAKLAAAEARAARLEELLRAMRVAAEAMPEYLPRIQKCRPAKSGFMAYMGQKAETCQGEEYGYVHKGRVIEILNRAALGPGGGA